MKVKILPIIIVVLFLVSSMNVIAITAEKEDVISISEKTDSISFSQATIEVGNDYSSVNIMEANTVLNAPGKPLLPVYVETFEFPLGTKIIDVECTPSEVKEEIISSKIEPAPRPLPLLSVQNSVGDEKVVIEEDFYKSSELYPDKWHEYTIGCGLNGNKRVLFLNVRCYPVRYSPA